MPPPTRRKRDVVTKKTTIAPPSSHPPADAAKKGSGGGGASAGAAAPASTSPSLFYPFRALGYITESAPFAVQRRGTEAFVTVSAGRAWQIYNCDKLRLVMVGPQFPADITALAARGDLTFAGVGRDIVVCRRSHRVCTFEGHAAAITLLIAFGSKLISVCAGGRVMAWDISRDAIDHLDGHRSASKQAAAAAKASMAAGDKDKDEDEDRSDSESHDGEDALAGTDANGTPRPRQYPLPDGFECTAVCHPDTYLNKILLGSSDGRLLLLNVSTGRHVHVFAPESMGNTSGAGVTALENSPALDTVAVGLSNGRVVVHNVLYDKSVIDFGHDGSGRPVRSCSFSSGQGEPMLAVGGDSGTVSVWSLEGKRLRTLITGAHDGVVVSAHFFPGQPVLMTSGGDNAVKQWIFDNQDGTARLLRFRAGHSAPPTHVTFYGEGKRLLSAGGDRALRVFSTIQDQQSKELSQVNVERRAKKLKLAEQELKLPPIKGIAWCEVRERDWANVVTCHAGEPRAYTWRLANGVLGEHVLAPPSKVGQDGVADKGKPVCSVAVSACGNFAFIGTEGGDVHRFNLQSGLHRGAFKRTAAEEGKTAENAPTAAAAARGPRRQLNFRGGARSIWNIADQSHGMGADASKARTAPAHVGAVSAIETDGSNKQVVTGGAADGVVRVWNFATQRLEGEMDTGCGVKLMSLHKPGSLVAAAGSDRVVRVLDVAGLRRVRSLKGAKTSIRALEFSSDGRWILAASTDGAVLVWDVPAARLLQTMRMSADSPVVGLSLSPAMDMLATVHEGQRGVYLWANSQMYSAPGALAGDNDAAGVDSGDNEEEEGGPGRLVGREEVEVAVDLPRLHAEVSDGGEIILGASSPDDDDDDDGEDGDGEGKRKVGSGGGCGGGGGKGTAASTRAEVPEPAAPGLATMALLPRTQWLGLLHLDTIRERNRPIAPPEKPKEAPFFLPTTASLERNPVFDVDAVTGEEDEEDEDAAAAASKSRILTVGGKGGGDVEGVLLRLLRRGKAAEDAAEDAALSKTKIPLQARGKKRAAAQGEGEGAGAAGAGGAMPAGGPYGELMAHLRKQGPSALDAEIRALGPWDVSTMSDADADELADVLDFFAVEIPSGRNFELLHALLAHFLRVHGAALAERESLRMRAERVRAAARRVWSGLDQLMQEVRCALGFFGGQH